MKKIIIKILRFFGIKANSENLTISHIQSFIQAKYRKFLYIFDSIEVQEFLGLPIYKQEQIIKRIEDLQKHSQGRICLKKGECPCECKTSEVLLSDSACDQSCFTDMLEERDWEEYKCRNNFYIDIKNKKVIYVTN